MQQPDHSHADLQIHTDALHVSAESGIPDSSAAMDPPVSSTPCCYAPGAERASDQATTQQPDLFSHSQIYTDAAHVHAGSGILDSSAAMDPPVSSTPCAAPPPPGAQ